MIFELKRKDFKRLLPLISDLYYDLAARSVVSGITPGRIWVDDPDNIQSALLWEQSQNSEFHFLGRADNILFNQSLVKLFRERIYPQSDEKSLKAYIGQYTEDHWKEVVPRMLSNPMQDYRRLYVFKPEDSIPDWKNNVPSEFRIVPVDKDLLSCKGLENLAGITDQTGMVWRSTGEFLRRGFGFCAIKGLEIASWCLAEYASPGRVGLGVETIEAFRRKGLATAVSAACLEYCKSKNLITYWICWKDNKPSIATAEKLGLQLITEYSIYYGWFGELDNTLSNASLRYKNEDYESALTLFTRAFKIAEGGNESYLLHKRKLASRYFYAAAVAAAVLKDKETAARYLHKAFEQGFTDFEKLKQEKRLDILHDTEAWTRILKRSSE